MNVHGHQETAIWHPRQPMGAGIVRSDVDFQPRRACCSPCRRAFGARLARLARLDKLQMGIGIHEDVCVDQVCYTSGPSDGVYRRDADMSRWALTDADGWSTLPGWSFDVDTFERDWLQTFMNDVVGDQVMSTNIFQSAWYFAGNVAKYVGNGFCITFSQKYFNDMSSMVSRRRGGAA